MAGEPVSSKRWLQHVVWVLDDLLLPALVLVLFPFLAVVPEFFLFLAVLLVFSLFRALAGFVVLIMLTFAQMLLFVQ